VLVSPVAKARIDLLVAALAFADAEDAWSTAFCAYLPQVPAGFDHKSPCATALPEVWERDVAGPLDLRHATQKRLEEAALALRAAVAEEAAPDSAEPPLEIAPMVAAHAAESQAF
jgi:hypothetical protein